MSIETGGPAQPPVVKKSLITDQERESFEHYFSDAGAWPATIRRDENGGGYLLQSAACAWEVWQARARLGGMASQFVRSVNKGENGKK